MYYVNKIPLTACLATLFLYNGFMNELILRPDFTPVAQPEENGFAIGTIIAATWLPSESVEGVGFVAATVRLDKPVRGVEIVGALFHNDWPHREGNRLRGILLFDVKEQQETVQYATSGAAMASKFMLKNPGIYFNHKTLHLAADDPTLRHIKYPAKANVAVLGVSRKEYDDYYVDNGYKIEAIEHKPAPAMLEQKPRWSFGPILNLLPWRKPADKEQPTPLIR